MADKREQIGNVILDLSRYSGQDSYSDGEVEDEILSIVKEHTPEEYDAIIRERKKWPVLYHLGKERENIAGWIPFTGTEKVLEIGAGPGAVTGILSEKCRSVACVELSRRRSEINAYRHKDAGNILIHVGNFEDIEPELDRDYDYVFLIGVLEYAASYLHGAHDPFRRELERIRDHVKKNADGSLSGRIVIAIENRLGLKYFAGCREDHSGRFFDGIESYPWGDQPATTFSVNALKQMFHDCGMPEYSFYYPYPDYKFTESIFSDRRLPDPSELSNNIRNFDRDRLLLFDEKEAYRGIVEDGLYPVFANSFEAVIGPALPVSYCKFSGERDKRFRIRTELSEADGKKEIIKYPLGKDAAAHVERLPESCRKLKERYGKADRAENGVYSLTPALQVAACRKTPDGGAAFEFISGRTLESILDEKLEKKDREGFLQLLSEYRKRVGANPEYDISDYDMTFANILVQGDMWTAIDYEWAVDRSIPAKELLYRSLLCFCLENPKRKEKIDSLINREEMLSFIGVTGQEAENLTKDETRFQDMVTGGTQSLGKLRAGIGGEVTRPSQLQSEKEKKEGLARARQEELRRQEEEYRKTADLVGIQVFFDTGRGFHEEEKLCIEKLYGQEGVCSFAFPVPDGCIKLRVDPASVPCIAMVKKACISGRDDTSRLFEKYMDADGIRAGAGYVFPTADPWFVWDLKKIRKKAQAAGKMTIQMTLQMAGIPGTMADALQ